MEKSSILFVGLALIFVAVNCSSADTEVDEKAKVISSSISDLNSTDTRLGGSELVTNDTTNAKKTDDSVNMEDKQWHSTGNDDIRKGKEELDDASSKANYGEKRANDEMGSEDMNTSSRKKEGFHGEECDPSNMCTNEEDHFVACLRVPGNDSPRLSLLIQNKGKSPLLVTISAPAFVRLEKSKVQLLKNEDKKVKVSIKGQESSDKAIVLTAGKGKCRLDLKELSAEDAAGNDDSVTDTVSRFSIANFRSQTLIVVIFFIVVCGLVLVPAFIHFYRKKNKWIGNKYQRLEEELPVSTSKGSKADKETDTETEGGWNNDWGDDWDDGDGDGDGDGDDEEAPKTPLMPLTPSVSSRGLASRKLYKEGWKD
ncbi:PREDICTED: uncharacterized protein LOC104817649 [Tarenaya hassleriana]|uniref:uncharacterized protein LOC104817649 n=1 Tax=Tarenaya hassleriana TaxID=28532 RepID=UPI00053C2EC7|nr:PREDICTED: uncharacterized protein LOC104817649 [Tarenaya hassleriana]